MRFPCSDVVCRVVSWKRISALQQACIHESRGGSRGYPADPGGAELRPGALHALLVQAQGPGVMMIGDDDYDHDHGFDDAVV